VHIDGFEDFVEIGAGGFANVYRARDVAFGRTVAIKVIRAGPGASETAFDRERKAIGALTGVPGIVPVYSSGYTDDGSLYMVMQFVPKSLADLIDGLSLDQAIVWMIAIAEGVDRAHSAGIVHRDIKPANILITANGVPLISDFGLARLVDTTQSVEHSFTPSFAAPAVFRGEKASLADDVYSLGATLFNMISGTVPFAGTTAEERDIFAQILRCSTEPVEDLRSRGIPDVVCAVVERAMAKEAAQRTPTAAQFARDLADASDEMATTSTVAAETVVVGGLGTEPSSDQYESRKPRRRIGAVGVALNIAVIAGLVFGLMWFQSRGSDAQPELRVDSQPSISESGGATTSTAGAEDLEDPTSSSSSSITSVEPGDDISIVTSQVSITVSAFEAASDTTLPPTTDVATTLPTPPATTTTTTTTTVTTPVAPTTAAPATTTTVAPTTTVATTTTVAPTTTTQGPVSVPAVTGFNGSQAVAVLSQAGLVSSCDTRCGDVVTGTNPGLGSVVSPGTTITLRF